MVGVLLPDELWGQICEQLTPRALSTISLTSQRFLAISRPIIYRHVTIHVDGTAPSSSTKTAQSVLSLLDQNPELATSVRMLCINAPNGALVPGLTADFFRNLINLKHLCIVGSILVASKGEAEEISKIVQGLPIERLDLREHPTNGLTLALNPRPVIAHGWTSPASTTINGQAEDLAIASIRPQAGSDMTPLLSYLPNTGFSQLTQLSLVNIDSERLPELLHFLAQCNHLEHLSLTFKPRRLLTEPPIDFGDVLLQLDPDSLPRLAYLGASSRFLNVVAQARLKSIASLDRLVIQRDQFNGPRLFLDTLDTIQEFYTQYDFEDTPTPIRPLQDLTVDFWVVNPSYPAMIIKRCAELWENSLVTLRLPFSTFNMATDWTPAWDELVCAIASFTKLKHVYFKRWVPSQSPNQNNGLVGLFRKRLVRRLVEKRDMLESIVFMEDDETVVESYSAHLGWERQFLVVEEHDG
jgi:hypothetical protein